MLLKGHAGDSLRVDRASRDPITIDHPAITAILMIQPTVLEDIGCLRQRLRFPTLHSESAIVSISLNGLTSIRRISRQASVPVSKRGRMTGQLCVVCSERRFSSIRWVRIMRTTWMPTIRTMPRAG